MGDSCKWRRTTTAPCAALAATCGLPAAPLARRDVGTWTAGAAAASRAFDLRAAGEVLTGKQMVAGEEICGPHSCASCAQEEQHLGRQQLFCLAAQRNKELLKAGMSCCKHTIGGHARKCPL